MRRLNSDVTAHPEQFLRETFYPKQMFMDRRNGNIVRKAFATRYDTPVQGPDLPYVLEMRLQQVRAAQEEYERELAAERERQAYNRRAQAFNEYQDLPIRERQLLANRDRIARRLWKGGYTQSEMDAFRLSRQELPELDRWA